MRRLVAGLLAGLLVLTGCSSNHQATVYQGSFSFVSPGGKTAFLYPVADRKPIGPIAGPDLAGDKTISVSDYAGKVVVLNFWGSWCPPCRAEAPGMEAAWRKVKDQGVQFVGINVKDEQGAGAAFNESKGITYPSIYDFGLRTMLSIRGYPTSSIPSTIVLDRQGRVASIQLTELTEQQLIDIITPIAGEK